MMKLVKIVFMGDSKVGKSQLLNRYLYNYYNENQNSILGAQFEIRDIPYENKTYKTLFYDITDIENNFTDVFKRNAHAGIVVIDITKEFDASIIEKHIKSFRRVGENKDVPIILVVNKDDELNKNEENKKLIVNFAKGKQQELNIKACHFVSAKENINIEEMFANVFAHALNNYNLKISTNKEPSILEKNLTGYNKKRENEQVWYKKCLSISNNSYLCFLGSFSGYSKDEKIHSVNLLQAFLTTEPPHAPNLHALAKHFEYTKSVENTIKALTSNRLGKICKDFFKNKKQAQEFEKFLNEIFQLYKQPNNSTTLTNPR